MRQINYKSDFDFILKFKACNGDVAGWPDYDWTAKFYTTQKVNAFVASCINGVAMNCFNDNGQVHVVMNNHLLSPGALQVEFTAELSDDDYPDKAERIVIPVPLEIELIRQAAPCPESFEVELMLPYIKGDKGDAGPRGEKGERGEQGEQGVQGVKGDKGDAFTYEDFTPEQIRKLQKPAYDAAAKAQEATDDANAAAEAATKSNTEFATAERNRANAESAREKAERNRASEFEKQVDRSQTAANNANDAADAANKAKQDADDAAANAQKVADDYAGTLDSKPDRSELSNVIAVDPLTEWEYPDTPEYRRLFIDQWNNACGIYGRYNADTGFFELNGLTDITYQQAMTIYNAGIRQSSTLGAGYISLNIRTHLPRIGGAQAAIAGSTFYGCLSIETVELINMKVGDYAFHNCRKLKRVCVNPPYAYSINSATHEAFTGCVALEEIRGSIRENNPVSFADSPLLSIESIKHMIDHAMNTAPITITLHPEAYARMTDELFAAAIAKNITIVSA